MESVLRCQLKYSSPSLLVFIYIHKHKPIVFPIPMWPLAIYYILAFEVKQRLYMKNYRIYSGIIKSYLNKKIEMYCPVRRF